MITVPNSPVNVAGDAVGSQHTISWQAVRQWRQNAPTEEEQPDHVAFYNESGVGYTIAINERSFTLPAGGWTDEGIALRTQDNSAVITAQYVLANAPVSSFFTDYYRPGEKVLRPSLGNSPIGLSAVSLPVTQVIQDSQPSGQTIVEATPTGGVQTLLITTDGQIIDRMSSAGRGILEWLGKLSGANAPVLQMNPSDGTINWGLFYNTSGDLTFFDATNSKTALTLVHNGGISSPNGAIQSINGQASAGSFGVPVIVAQALDTSVTVTTQQTILSFTPTATGLYRANMDIVQGTATAAALLAQVHFTDPHQGIIGIDFVWGQNGTPVSLNGTNSIGGGPNVLNLMPITFRASAGNAVTILYRDPAGTPADFVTALIERLA